MTMNKYTTEEVETIAKVIQEMAVSLTEFLMTKLSSTGNDPISQIQKKYNDPLFLSGIILRSAANVAATHAYATIEAGKTTQEAAIKRVVMESHRAISIALELGLQTSDVKNVIDIELYKLLKKD